ncbi:MAG: mechanosensitive ion channel family protein [Oscillatoriales cyanobacterium C42_A2020_001]|nr:mechanosensitive ion channel family protein [Leptolyngbyaceae cyanobacterium C42_A2020_001]
MFLNVLSQLSLETKPTNLYEVLSGMAVVLFPRIVWAILILLLTRFAIGISRQLSRRFLNPVEPTIRKFFIQTAEVLTLIVGLVAALNVLGIQTATLVAILGAAGLAVGLALQSSLSHFAAGVMLVSFRPFEVGDFIDGAGVAGVVDSIGIFSTTVITPDNVKIVVPNNNLFTGTLKNLTAMGTRRVDLEVNIGDRPIDATIVSLLSLVQHHPLILNDPKITCNVASITADATILYLRPWCSTEVYDQAKSEMQQLVKEFLKDSSVG